VAHEHAAAHHLVRRIICCGTSSAAAHHLLRRIICCGTSSAAAHHLVQAPPTTATSHFIHCM
jgi:hypothetical protein